MNRVLICLLFLCLYSCSYKANQTKRFTTLFEESKGTETPEYDAVISFYKDLSEEYPEVSLFSFGKTDSGKPLHLVVYNQEKIDDPKMIKNSIKNRILINNGIHPGEPDGIDASMMFIRDIVQNDSLKKKYKNSIIAIIPVYNIGGALKRNSYTRANQSGPKEYGFRGNARNYDLNRDFIKQDTKNSIAFSEVFHIVKPDVFIDNHVSNGADYQYAITHLFTQHNKLGGSLGDFLENKMRPQIEQSLRKKRINITPYVNVWGTTPAAGFSQFYDSPRYSTGYTALFNTLGLMVETHMLKSYKIRVKQTYELMFSVVNFTQKHSIIIKELRENAVNEIMDRKTYPILYKVDKNNPTELQFKGYEGKYVDSKVTTGKRLLYDRTKPYNKTIKYYNNFIPTKEVTIPKGYILEQGWHKIIKRLEHNKIEFTRFKKDTVISVEVSHIDNFETRKKPYEGHYLHYNTTVLKSVKSITFTKGDIYIPTNQKGIRYLLETLEAEAVDSFFNWNFFDTILQQKESYSSYVFEDIAEDFLNQNSVIKKEFQSKLKTDKEFANSPSSQLNFIYKKSPHYESVHLRLPIFKVK